jgi:pimeloyl-ACP methyl ester carboxylesterase
VASTLDTALAILNGAIGDYLERAGNGLALPMEFVHRAPPEARPRVVVLVPGLMCTEGVWGEEGKDYGACLARDLGYTPLYVRYNTGLPIADNGALLADLLRSLAEKWPVALDEILLLGFSMGGLVLRSACHVGSGRGDEWLARVRRAIYVGTPHLGAPLERASRFLTRVLAKIPDPYTQLAAQISELRSSGIKDLGDADLRHEDRTGRLSLLDREHPVPLLSSIRHYLAAGALSDDPRLAALFGDALVPVPSATNGTLRANVLPPSHVKVFSGAAHLSLAQRPDVYAQIREWCTEEES